MNNTKRYSRQMRLPEIGKAGQEKLRQSSVLVIGAGGLGCPVIQYLAAAGIGRLGIMDHDVIDESNLHRQPLYVTSDIGKSKAEVAALRAKALSADIMVESLPVKLSHENALECISHYDVVADCSDNFATRYLVNDACVLAGKPWVFGAIEGWEGQVSVFNLEQNAQRGPTYRCLFPEAPAAGEAPDCDTIGVIATLPAVIGSLQANEIIKCLAEAGEPLSGQLLTVDLLHNQFHTFQFARNEEAVKAITSLPKTVATEESTVEIGYDRISPDFTLIDIRESFEWEEDTRIRVNIPYHDLLLAPDMLLPKKSYVLVCEHGKRSLALATALRKKTGMENIYSLKGGLATLG